MTSGRRVVFTGLNQVEVEALSFPDPSPGQLLVETRRTLISTGTELAHLTGAMLLNPASATMGTFPAGSGYCSAGVVLEVGQGVHRIKPGDRVVSSGAHASHAVVDASSAWLIPDGVDAESACFGILGEIVLGGLRRSRLSFGESVVVIGAGLIGQLTVLFCRAAGATPIVVIDPVASRLETARVMGASTLLSMDAGAAGEHVAAATAGRMADVVFEVTGNPKAINGALKLARMFGRLVLLGSPRGSAVVDLYSEAHRNCLEILGAHNNGQARVETPQNPWTLGRHVELFLTWQQSGIVDVRPLITHTYPWRRSPEAFQMLVEDRTRALGVVLNWHEEAT